MRQVLGADVGDDTVERLVSRADGHAFYLEELIRAVAAGKGAEPPETVLAMVQARLERLDPEARRVLRAASVFGETFWRGGVEALLGITGPGPWLAELCSQEVIAVKEHGRFPGDIEYRFRHSLVREAAYGMLADADRVLGHRLAAQWLEQAGETDAMVLAEHFERGASADRAVAWFLRATEQALEGGDLDAVLVRASRGLACGATGATRGALQGMAGYVHAWRTQHIEAAACFHEALLHLPRGSAAWYRAIGGGLDETSSLGDFARVGEMIAELRAGLAEQDAPIASVQGMTAAVPVLCVAGEYELARDFIGRFATEGEGAGLRLAIARCHYAFFADGDPWALRAHALAALAQASGEARVIHMAQAYEGIALVKLGAAPRGEQMLREVRASAASLGLHLIGRFADLFLADALTNRKELDESEALLCECRAQAEQSAVWGGVWLIFSARVARRRSDFEAARELLLSAIEVFRALSPGYSAHAHGMLGNTESQRGGDPTVAIALIKEGLRRLDQIGTWYNDVAIRVYSAEALDLAGDRAGAEAALAAARAQIEARASGIDDEAFRRSYLENVPENVRAGSWRARGGWTESVRESVGSAAKLGRSTEESSRILRETDRRFAARVASGHILRSRVCALPPQTLAVPPPPQVCGAAQVPHWRTLPQPSPTGPQLAPSCAHVFGVQLGCRRRRACRRRRRSGRRGTSRTGAGCRSRRRPGRTRCSARRRSSGCRSGAAHAGHAAAAARLARAHAPHSMVAAAVAGGAALDVLGRAGPRRALGAPHTLGVPPPPQVCRTGQVPQCEVAAPVAGGAASTPSAMQVVGVQAGRRA